MPTSLIYPIVPIAPGVPPLGRNASNTVTLPTLQTADSTSLLGSGLKPQWGIYSSTSLSQPVLQADTVTAFDFKGEEVIADFPIESGNFESYDKVRRPYEARIQFVVGWSQASPGFNYPSQSGQAFASRQNFLVQVENLLHELTNYAVVTPEIVYTNANVIRYDYQRTTAKGVNLLTVNVYVQEVLVQGNTAISAAPSGEIPVYSGPIQTTTPTPQQIQTIQTAPSVSAGP